jgi:hypothetical protein
LGVTVVTYWSRQLATFIPTIFIKFPLYVSIALQKIYAIRHVW